VPALLYDKDWPAVMRELLDSFSLEDNWVETIAISMACHSAVRAGQPLTTDEITVEET
jgi:DNA mismatch repair ATPase MutL